MEKVNLAGKFALFDDRWSPKLVAVLDDYDIKLAKLEGEFVWHKHDGDDEFFLVVDGHLSIDFRDRTVDLDAGEFLVVPKGVEHRPRAERECRVLLIERAGVVNTGDAPAGALTRHTLDRI
ncbi:MAG: cupin domain-containing protein [Rhodospirillales bacterium]|nr:MAG: cupin domain-containing protein [Rhodospirillales bacterium]